MTEYTFHELRQMSIEEKLKTIKTQFKVGDKVKVKDDDTTFTINHIIFSPPDILYELFAGDICMQTLKRAEDLMLEDK